MYKDAFAHFPSPFAMTDAYLEGVARKALTDGLIATARTQPEDPVDFLGRYLIHYADHLDAHAEVRRIPLLLVFRTRLWHCPPPSHMLR